MRVDPNATRTSGVHFNAGRCKFGCKFCASGLGGWKRNLTRALEILTQVLHVKEESLKHKRPLSNIVFSGHRRAAGYSVITLVMEFEAILLEWLIVITKWI